MTTRARAVSRIFTKQSHQLLYSLSISSTIVSRTTCILGNGQRRYSNSGNNNHKQLLPQYLHKQQLHPFCSKSKNDEKDETDDEYEYEYEYDAEYDESEAEEEDGEVMSANNTKDMEFDGYDHEIDDPNVSAEMNTQFQSHAQSGSGSESGSESGSDFEELEEHEKEEEGEEQQQQQKNTKSFLYSSALDSDFSESQNSFEDHNRLIIDKYSVIDDIPKLSEKEDEKRKKFLSKQREVKKTEYEIMQQRRKKLETKVTKQMQIEKPIHHRIFSHIHYEPTFPESYPPTDIASLDPTSLKTPTQWHRKRCGIIAKKMGMMSLFDKNGIQRAVTIARVDSCSVVQLKTKWNEKHGTFGIQLGYGHKKIHKFSQKWGLLGHYVKQGVAPKEKLIEFQVGKDALLPVGTELTCRHFIAGQFIDVQGVTKGKGFQGVMKRWNFKGGPASHGSEFHRKRGATGGGMDPGRIWKGKRMPGNMGNKLHTKKSLRVFRIEPKQNLIYIAGHVPGPPSGYLKIRDAHFHPPASPPYPTFFPPENETNETMPEFMQWKPERRPWWGRETNPDAWGDRVSHDLI